MLWRWKIVLTKNLSTCKFFVVNLWEKFCKTFDQIKYESVCLICCFAFITGFCVMMMHDTLMHDSFLIVLTTLLRELNSRMEVRFITSFMLIASSVVNPRKESKFKRWGSERFFESWFLDKQLLVNKVTVPLISWHNHYGRVKKRFKEVKFSTGQLLRKLDHFLKHFSKKVSFHHWKFFNPSLLVTFLIF